MISVFVSSNVEMHPTQIAKISSGINSMHLANRRLMYNNYDRGYLGLSW